MDIEGARSRGDDAARRLTAALEALTARAAARLAAVAGVLATDANGRVIQSADNVRRISAAINEASRTLFDDQYISDIADYMEGLNDVSSAVSSSFRSFGVDDAMLGEIAKRTKASMLHDLTSPLSFRRLLGAVADQMTMAVVTGSKVTALSAGIRKAVDTTGVDASVKQAAESAPAMMQRAQTAAASEGAGIVFYRFQGRPIKTTRPWCRDREGRVWHIEEIREWGRKAAAGDGWEGMVEGTNEQTIFTFLGGWYGDRNTCRHVLVPVMRARVPREDLDRMIARGLIEA
jgi:hypothetical protein